MSNCTFYYKIGACRHGDKCSRQHNKPTHSKTVMVPNFYQNPKLDQSQQLTQAEVDKQFDEFFQDVFIECSLMGCQVEDMIVCENSNDHLSGNVYIKFATDSQANKVVENFNNRWYNKRPIYCELSPVHNFKDSCCRQHFTSTCERGGMCNFMHSKRPTEGLFRDLWVAQMKNRDKKYALT